MHRWTCLIAILTLGFGALITTSCDRQPAAFDRAAEQQRVEQAIHDCIGWAKTKDLDKLHAVIAHDEHFLSVHPEKRVVRGFNDFRSSETFWMHDDFRAVGYEITDLKIRLNDNGTVAWFYCVLDDWNEWKGQPANWENTRWTGVLEKRSGNWVIVQMHFSFVDE